MFKLLKSESIFGRNFNGLRNKPPDANKSISRPVSTFRVTQTCRVCLQHGNIPVFNKNKLDFPLSHYLKLICNIDMTVNDTYPQHLCKTCFDALDSAIKLRKTALKSQLKLKLTSLKHLGVKGSLNTEEYKCISEMIPLERKEVRKELKERDQIYSYDVPSLSPLQKAETKSNFLETLETKISSVQALSPLERKDIDHRVETSQTDSQLPIVTLDQVNKLRTKDIPYDNYYKRVATSPDKQTYQCRICKKNYKKSSIADHILVHLPDSVQYVCEVCGKTFKKFCTFYKHRFIHQNILPFECKICPYKGRTKSLLQVHIKRVHKKEYKYECSMCPRKFIDTNNLRYHLRRHEKPKFQCNMCHKAFYENGLLRKHTESQHMDLLPQRCDICGNLYKNRKNLLSHQIKIHKRKQVYNNRASYLKLNQHKSD